LHLKGEYDKKNKVFKGLMRINDTSYANCILSSGFSAIYYKETDRNLLGKIYFDNDFNNLSLELDDMQLIRQLSNEGTGKLVISFPATDRKSAINIHSTLEQK
jgi:hypothetical protein